MQKEDITDIEDNLFICIFLKFLLFFSPEGKDIHQNISVCLQYLQQPLELVEREVEVGEVVVEQATETIVKHDLHEHTERLLLRHLRWINTQSYICQSVLYTLYKNTKELLWHKERLLLRHLGAYIQVVDA